MNPDEIKDLAELLAKVPGIKGIDLKDVRRVVELLKESPEIGSIELKGWFGTGVIITRTNGVAPAGYAPVPLAPMPPPAPVAAPPPAEPERPKAPPAQTLKEIKSPMVGTFYASPEPGAGPYVKVGSRITPGQTVCIIEAMKIMNEIEAEFGGIVREVSVEDSQPVEFGHVLFRVDPNG
jgi:acetyl-CoA carboxylase biotin carboxyl carrier protein